MTTKTPIGPAAYVRGLFTSGRRGHVPLPLNRTRSPGGSDRIRDMAATIKKGSIEWLCREGGWRPMQVVTKGKRRTGRIWQREIWDRLGIRYSDTSLRLVQAMIEAGDGLPDLDPSFVDQVSASFDQDDTPVGDLLAMHRLVEPLLSLPRQEPPDCCGPLADLIQTIHRCTGAVLVARDGHLVSLSPDETATAELTEALRSKIGSVYGWTRIEPEGLNAPMWAAPIHEAELFVGVVLKKRTRRFDPETSAVAQALDILRNRLNSADEVHTWEAAQRRRDLLRVSPLTQLFEIDEAALLEGVLPKSEALEKRFSFLRRGHAHVLLSYLDESLSRRWIQLEKARRGFTERKAAVYYAGAAVAYSAMIEVLSGRRTGLRPLVRYFSRFVSEFGTRDYAVARYTEQSKGYDRTSERTEFLRTVSLIFAAGTSLEAAAQKALETAFVDRPEEDRAYLSVYHDGYKHVTTEIEAIRKELAGEIG